MGHTQRPKQFLPIGGRPILIHTVERFLHAGCIDRVLVAVPAKWMEYTKVLLEKYLPEAAVSVVEGGEDRNGSLLRVCGYIEKTLGIKGGGRPCFPRCGASLCKRTDSGGERALCQRGGGG